ncbi:porin family protein [Flavobacterium sp. NRK1]|uniref:porin family protein n=1 Tax=Flavobacterium sp. NRK1 TaxID=2954929 RepID=UPI00209220FF|nr:porin family protein [Flavobacterium sp. NRK1]MCO6148217.1 porin family protein [Flavobacterium sp. NRK1]
MEVKKDIGKAFREKLDNLDRMPNDALWDAISKDLDSKKKRRFPLFWFFIGGLSLLAIVGTIYFITYLKSDNNAGEIKQESLQKNIQTDSPSIMTTESATLKKGVHKDCSGNGETKAQNRVNDAGNAFEDINNTTTNSNNKGSTGKSIISDDTSSRNVTNKKNSRTGTNSKQDIQHSEQINTGNSKIVKDGDAKKDYPTSLYISKNKASSVSAKANTKSDYSSATTIIETTNQTIPSKQERDSEPGKQSGTMRDTTIRMPADKTNTAIITREQIPAIPQDSLPEDILIKKDSLKTELPKEEATEKKENIKDSLTPIAFKRFSMFANGEPSFFSFPDRKIVTDSTTSNINTKSLIRFGLLFGYKLNKKLSIRTGVSFYKLKQSANNIKLNYVMGGDAVNPEFIPSDDFTWIDYKYPFGTNSGLIIDNLGENYQAIINIDRELSYLQIPLEIGYNLFEKKFGLSVFGGGSLLLLTKNEVFAHNENGRMYLGKWNAAAKTSFTGNLGLGLHYNLSPSLQLNAEPMLNYYFNSYKDSKPYSFNIRLGLQYNFDIGLKKK